MSHVQGDGRGGGAGVGASVVFKPMGGGGRHQPCSM